MYGAWANYPFGDTERMRITPAGNVGIGTTSPIEKLQVQGNLVLDGADNQNFLYGYYNRGSFPTYSYSLLQTGAADAATGTRGLIINEGHGQTVSNYGITLATNSISRLFINTAGNVGIGTISPSSILHIERSSATNNIIGTPSIIISNQNSTSGTFIGGGIFNNPYRDVSGSSITAGVWFENQNSPDAGAAAKQSAIVFGAQSYATGYNTPSERMRITAAGNVGIGTTAPTAILQTVSSGLGDGGGIRITNSGAGGDDYRIWPTATINGEGAGKLIFSNNGGNVLTLTSAGNVIIGSTTDGGFKLDVHGEILGRDDLRILNTYALVLNGTDDNWRIGRNTITDSGWLTSNTTQIVVSNASSGQGFQVVNSGGTALFEVEGISGYTRISISLGVGVNPSGTTGRIDASNDIVAFSTSDRRLKENITPIPFALDKVKALTGVMFDWKEETKEAHGHSGRDTGIIAQEVQAVMPTAVRTNDTGYLAVRYEKLIGLLIEANKELADQVANQQVQIDELKKLIK